MDAEQVIGALASAVPLAAGIALAWPVNDARRQRRVTTWARTNLVPLSPGIARALDQSIHRRNRVAGVAVSIAAIGLSVLLATGWEALATAWALIVAMGIALTLAGVWQLQRDWFRPSHSRSARVREVTLDDYVPRPARLCAWTAGLLCLTASVASAIIEPSPDAAPITLGVGVLAAVAVAEWGGRRAASRPQPARDAAELYAQDAWRSEVARNGFQNIPLWGGMALMQFQWSDGTALHPASRIAALGLMIVAFIPLLMAMSGPAWTRKRLWPQLRPGQCVVLDSGIRA